MTARCALVATLWTVWCSDGVDGVVQRLLGVLGVLGVATAWSKPPFGPSAIGLDRLIHSDRLDRLDRLPNRPTATSDLFNPTDGEGPVWSVGLSTTLDVFERQRQIYRLVQKPEPPTPYGK